MIISVIDVALAIEDNYGDDDHDDRDDHEARNDHDDPEDIDVHGVYNDPDYHDDQFGYSILCWNVGYIWM